jgi:hypothetical protein
LIGPLAGVRWVSRDPQILEAAACVKACDGLSVVDAWIAGTRCAPLVYEDPNSQALGRWTIGLRP